MRREKTTVTLDKELKDELLKKSNELGISLSAYITIILKKAVKENGKVC